MPKLIGEKCTATAKGTGERCKRNVIGGGVCPMHGGNAPQVRAAREARIITAEAAAAAPRTAAEAADVLLGAMNDSHAILQQMKIKVASGEVTVADLDALGAWIDRASKTSKVVIDAGIEERRTQLAEQDGRLVAQMLQRVLAALLAGVLELQAGDPVAARRVQSYWQGAVKEIVPRELRAVAGGQA